MTHPNVALVQRLYGAYLSGDKASVVEALDPAVRWEVSGFGPAAGTYEGIDAVVEFLFEDNHMDDFQVEVIDVLASEDRVAVIARSSGRRGERRLVNDYVQVASIDEGRIREVRNYTWDQQAVADFMAVPI